jgi:hypothetical protein
MSEPVRGRCLCGGVKFEITGPLTSPLNCHCSQCRRQHGAAFRSRVRVKVEDFRWLQGEGLIKFYESERGFLRGFCRECGSPVINGQGPNYQATAGFPGGAGEYGVPLARAARVSRFRRQQGAVVRHHRRPAAISRLSAASRNTSH